MPEQYWKKLTEQQLAQEALEKMRKEQQQWREINAQERAGKREARTSEASEMWDKYLKTADAMVEAGQKGYDSWVTSLSECVLLAMKRANALDASDPLGSLLSYIQEGLAYPIAHAVSDLWHRNDKGPKIVDFPTFENFVQFKDDSTLNMEFSLVRTDGKPADAKDSHFFKIGVIAWLNDKGYTGGTVTGRFQHKETGEWLDKATFEVFRDQDEGGLQKYLSGRYQMNFQQALSPSPGR